MSDSREPALDSKLVQQAMMIGKKDALLSYLVNGLKRIEQLPYPSSKAEYRQIRGPEMTANTLIVVPNWFMVLLAALITLNIVKDLLGFYVKHLGRKLGKNRRKDDWK